MTASPQLQGIAERYLGGEISAPLALMEMLLETRDAEAAARGLTELRGDAGRLAALGSLLAEHRNGCTRITALLQSGLDTPSELGDAALERIRRQFDRAVVADEAASVALYCLGSPKLLGEATDEVVRVLEAWQVLDPSRRALEIGCGIGRFLVPLAARLKQVQGIDVSPKMVEVARRRLAHVPNTEVLPTNGRDLSRFGSETFDLVYAVDVFPYLVEVGRELVEVHFREIARVLCPAGDFVLFNYAYGRTLAANAADVREHAAAAGFECIRSDVQPFRLWDGVGFHLRKA